jgi:hypothetical protein
MTKILPVFLLGLFMFAVSSFSYAADTGGDSPKDPAVRALIDKEALLKQKCNGGFGDSMETKMYCKERDAVVDNLRKKGWCWGYPEQVEADKVWHECSDKSKLEKKSPYFLSLDAWECPRPGSLLDNHMLDVDSGCLPPLRRALENVAVMDVDKDFAYVCVPVRGSKDIPEGFTSILCNYVLVASIVDKGGQNPDPAKLKERASRQTMKAVRDL